MSQWIYGILIGILLGFYIGYYTAQPVSEGFQTTANDSIPEINTASSCATIDLLSNAFIKRMESNPIFSIKTGTSADIASRQNSLRNLIDTHKKSVQEEKMKIGCS